MRARKRENEHVSPRLDAVKAAQEWRNGTMTRWTSGEMPRPAPPEELALPAVDRRNPGRSQVRLARGLRQINLHARDGYSVVMAVMVRSSSAAAACGVRELVRPHQIFRVNHQSKID